MDEVKIISSINDRISGIYCIENSINSKKYIGKSSNIKSRLFHHISELRGKRSMSNLLQKDWNKYGEETFRYYIIEICDTKNLDEKEEYWIKYYDSNRRKFGYNKSTGGAGSGHYKKTKTQKERLSEIKKGVLFSDTHRKNISESLSNKVRNRTKTKSNYIGINFRNKNNKEFWTVRINVNGKRINIGDSVFEIEAAMMYNEAALEYFGWNAKLNEITEDQIEYLWSIEDVKRKPINNKLGENDVYEIKNFLSENVSVKELSILYKVSEGTIYAIKNNKSWDYLNSFPRNEENIL